MLFSYIIYICNSQLYVYYVFWLSLSKSLLGIFNVPPTLPALAVVAMRDAPLHLDAVSPQAASKHGARNGAQEGMAWNDCCAFSREKNNTLLISGLNNICWKMELDRIWHMGSVV